MTEALIAGKLVAARSATSSNHIGADLARVIRCNAGWGSRKTMLDREMLKAYQSRWQAVNDVETLERQQASLALRSQQLNALFAMAAALGLVMPQDKAPEDDVVIHRWNRLVALHLTRSQDALS